MLNLNDLDGIDPRKAKELVPRNTGIYFWLDKETDELVYVGTGSGRNGLYNRIVRQHLNPDYIEFRENVHSFKDRFQLKYPVIKEVKGKLKPGIDQSAFRKNIGRKLHVKPGNGTVNYILENLYLKFQEINDIQELKRIEKEMIKKHQPKFNISHKYKLMNRKI